MPSRRTFVTTVGLATATLAGCTGLGDGDDPTNTDQQGDRTTQRPSAVSAEIVGFDDVDAPVRVLPEGLRTLLVDAARADGAVRGHYRMLMNGTPSPDLPSLGTVELRGTDGVDGTYSAEVQAGGRYLMQFEAAPASSVPDDATVVEGSDLPPEQREFVRNAADDSPAEAYPETELGTFARTVLTEQYVRLDGEVYTGRELEQTDAEFFADRIWYVLTLTPTEDAASPTVLDCAPVEPGVPERVVSLLEDSTGTPRSVPEPSDGLVRVASELDAVLLHNAVARLQVG